MILLRERGADWAEYLGRTGRLHTQHCSVTLAALREIGALHFCWLLPNEKCTGPPQHMVEAGSVDADWTDRWPLGAFFYAYKDPRMNCLFTLDKVVAEA